MTDSPPRFDWRADVYHRVSAPQLAWGERVLAQLELRGDERVVDAGAGTGRLTARLLDRVPRGHVIALDGSRAMLDVARRELARFGERVSFVQAELGRDPLPPCDLVFSTATFHWVLDHDALFSSIFRALADGGRLHAQCGGDGNLARAHALIHEVTHRAPYEEFLRAMPAPWEFATPETTRERLARAGFVDIQVDLEDAPTPFASAEAYATFVGAVVLRPYLERLPVALHDSFVRDVTARAEAALPSLHLDYVRLNIRAKRRGSPR